VWGKVREIWRINKNKIKWFSQYLKD